MKSRLLLLGLAIVFAVPCIASAWYDYGYSYGYEDIYDFGYGGYGYHEPAIQMSFGYPSYSYDSYNYHVPTQNYYQPAYQNSHYQYTQSAALYSYQFNSPYLYNYSAYPTGDYIPYVNEPLCNYPGYGRYSCNYHPGQPLYDYWTGTWY